MTENSALRKWVEEVAQVTQPDQIVFCDGSEEENRQLIELMLKSGDLLQLNPKTYPNCYLHRSHKSDVARTEHLTFICSDTKDEAGPTNNWMSAAEAKQKVWPLFQGAMRGRTMYVVPYLMGPEGSPTLQVRFAPAWLSFLPQVWGAYWVVELDADYQLAVVSEPQREFLWVLSRQPTLPAAQWAALEERLRALGFDPARLIRSGEP
jgi:hypothetical protein